MSHQSDLIATDIEQYLAQHERKQLMRFITCGSVDDGKSTLIGRLLYDSKMLYEDQLKQIEADSKTQGTTGGAFDPALVTDGLRAEREQGITIDVAYRYFSTARRKFIIADTPGHEQYTRNMATGASTADLAIILIDARHGVLTQTRRHSFIVSLLGIRHIVVAVNKMDLCGFSEARFEEICNDYRSFATRLDLPDVHFIPISALNGDNLVDPSPSTPWYKGSTLMNLLETVYIGSDRNLRDFRFPVQYVNRPNLDFRGFCGTIASGTVRPGDEVMVLPSRQKTKVKQVVTYDGNLEEAFAPLAVTLTLADEVDASRGDMIVRPGNVPRTSDNVEAMLVWMDQSAMVPGKTYLIKHTTQTVPGSIETLRYRIDVNTLHRSPAPHLELNEIGRVQLSLGAPIHFDPYRINPVTGSLIIIDRITNSTVAAGMIIDAADGRRSDVIWEQDLADSTTAREQTAADASTGDVTVSEREARFGQKPLTVLFTGLTGSGKTTLARAVERRLFDAGRAVTVLDGSWVRRGLSRDLGYSAEDRSENLRRAAHLAAILNEAGMICLAAFVAPDEQVRQKVAALIGPSRFKIVHVATPVDVCRSRDQSGQYEKADAGELPNFPGVTARYDQPASADLTLDLGSMSLDEAVTRVVELIQLAAKR
jgi:bifunctional enzyme CysN/CysC